VKQPQILKPKVQVAEIAGSSGAMSHRQPKVDTKLFYGTVAAA